MTDVEPEINFCTMCSDPINAERGPLLDGVVSWPNGTDILTLCSVECLEAVIEDWQTVRTNPAYAEFIESNTRY